jgi:putative membrane protein
MRSKLQPIAVTMAAIFLMIGGIPIAYGQQSGAANMQENSPANAKENNATMTQQESISNTDKQCVNSALQDGMLEVAVSKEAAERSTNKDVQSFAKQMIQAHSKANDQLRQIAQKGGLQTPVTMGTKNDSEMQKLSKFNGSKFDDAYMRFAIKTHEKAINMFTKEAKEGTDQDLKTFASQTLPTLQHHLSMAESLHQKMASRKSPWWEFWKRA